MLPRVTMRARATRLAGIGLVAATMWTGCSRSPLNGSGRLEADAASLDAFGPDADAIGDSISPRMARAFIGPDVNLRVPCGATVQAPVASVDVVGVECTEWSIA